MIFENDLFIRPDGGFKDFPGQVVKYKDTIDIPYVTDDGTKDSNYETTQTKDFTHTLKINPVTDKPELKIESISDLTNSEVNGTKVSIKNSTASFTVNTKTTSIDTDGTLN